MKRLIISIALALLSLTAAVFSYYDVKCNSEKIVSMLESSIESIESSESDYGEAVLQSARLWEKCRKRYELYLYSEDLFEIDLNFAKMEKLLGTDDTEELKELMNENVFHLRRMADNQSPTVEKIF